MERTEKNTVTKHSAINLLDRGWMMKPHGIDGAEKKTAVIYQ